MIVEDQEHVGICISQCGITVKTGIDGEWLGATSGDSSVSSLINPGLHHLCATWQSKKRTLRNRLQLTSFTAKPGHTCYFRTHVTPGTTETIAQFDLQALDADEGKLLTASSPKSVWKLK